MSPRATPISKTLSRPRDLVGPAARLLQARYSRFVGLMKMALPAIAAALLGLIFVWPKLAPRDEAFQVAFANFNMKAVDTLSMAKPRYFGTDDKNLPFTLTADTATQVDQQNMAVALEKPVADLTNKDGSGMVVNSDVGFYRQKDGTLDLMGHVDLFQDSGYEMHTDSARIEVGPGNATGDEPAHGHGPSGTIEGEGFRLWERGKTILFTGKSKAVLTMAKNKGKS
ncbi:LPS export ABC transporter periplasmic protein LptC [Telmatospirillum siberiense]|uniref:LPS export ABC transporter periplasmic protein LptC n=1 Tax=Telmatospirillum siberiense TaxID=382514 RepID=A0A2N3PST3_9PROT|nr:LPS export ABC transporter periplasmic protein LptC [Telmatospirillum siberiense]PKU23426.1 LPS export ABC transporter periplasmic protein LptC [Telmatospirillum siberiense]